MIHQYVYVLTGDFILYIYMFYKQLQAITPIRSDIIKSLSLYYYTFVDLLDFKDQVCELLTTMDACQIHLDIVSYIILFSFN